jgi:ABC-type nitrate/sulfonate/bicarbonate transport system substrate-binding protein
MARRDAHRNGVESMREDPMLMSKTLRCATLAVVVGSFVFVAPARSEDTVTIGTVGSPSANLWPLFIGIEKGFYAAENVKPDLIFIQSSAAVIQQLSAGSLDMSMSTGIVDPLRAIDQGAALALTRFEVQVPPYALLAKASIKSLPELKGKTISVGGPKDITRLYVDRMLAPHGLKAGDYDYHYAGATTARAQALLSGAVDAAILLPPSNFQVQSQGFNDLGLAMKYAPELAFSGTVVNRAWAARSADLLKRVLAVQSKSTEYLYDPKNRSEAVSILVKVSGQKPEDVDKSYDFFNKNNFFDRTGKISRAKMTALIDALVGLGDVKAAGNVERFVLPGVAQLSD